MNSKKPQKMTELPESVKDQLICDIIDSVSLKEDGTPTLKFGTEGGVSHDGLMSYNKHLWLLYSLDDFVASTLNPLRFSLSTAGFFGMEFFEVFANLKKENRRSFGDFEKEFNAMVDKQIKNLPQKRFTLAFALNFKIKEEIKFKIDVHGFRVIPYDKFKQEFIDFDATIQQAANKIAEYEMKEWMKLSEGFSFFIIDVFSRNPLFAQICASRILQCLMGLLVFSKTKTSGDRYTVGGSLVKSKLALSTVFTFESGKCLNKEKYSSERRSCEEIEEYDLRNLEASLSYFNANKALTDVIFEGLIPYYWASVDEDLDGSAFKYWICIEQLLLKSSTTSEAEIVRRIKNMPFWGANKYLDYEIDGLYEKRNRYAHEFEAEFHQLERNLAKSIADALLEFLLVHNQDFSNEHELLRFYELIQKDSAKLERMLDSDKQTLETKRMADLILGLRK